MGIREGVTGFAFAERDVAALTDHLIRVLTDDALATRLSDAAPGFVAAGHDVHRCTARLERLYDRVAGVDA